MSKNLDKIFAKRLWLPGWGEIALSALQLALISGMMLIPLFTPGANAFESVSLLNGSGLLGRWLHSFHSYTGDIFLFAAAIHTIEYLLKKSYRDYQLKPWALLIALALLSLLAVFSGFLSIGSKESIAALHIFSGIMEMPGRIGQALALFFLGNAPANVASAAIYFHHIATFTVLTVILTYIHLKRLKAESYAFYYALVLLLLISLLFPAQIGQALSSPAQVVKGPWYFIGLQEQLAWMPVWLAGWLMPVLLLLLLALLPVLRRYEKFSLYAFTVFAVFYLAEGIIGWFLRGAGWQILLR